MKKSYSTYANGWGPGDSRFDLDIGDITSRCNWRALYHFNVKLDNSTTVWDTYSNGRDIGSSRLGWKLGIAIPFPFCFFEELKSVEFSPSRLRFNPTEVFPPSDGILTEFCLRRTGGELPGSGDMLMGVLLLVQLGFTNWVSSAPDACSPLQVVI